MATTTTRTRRLALLPVEDRSRDGRPAIRRYTLGRVLGDLGSHMAAPAALAGQAPASGDRAP